MRAEIYLLWERVLQRQIALLAAIERANLFSAAECALRRARLAAELAEVRAWL